MADEPIDEKDFNYGVKVVDIGDIRVSRGQSRRPKAICKHKKITYDLDERRVWCRDCENDVDSFDAFELLVSQQDIAIKQLKRLKDQALAAEAHNLRRIAAKNLEIEWNKRNSLPCCPHCKSGLMAEDFKKISQTSRSIEIAKRNRAIEQ